MDPKPSPYMVTQVHMAKHHTTFQLPLSGNGTLCMPQTRSLHHMRATEGGSECSEGTVVGWGSDCMFALHTNSHAVKL